MRADLHIHSHYSDGSSSPAEIFSVAEKSGLGIVSITDHDTVDQIQPSREQAAKYGIDFIPGVEFSTSLGSRDVHVLGYALDAEDPGLLKYLDKVRLRRIERAHQILELLRRQDIVIPLEEIDRIPEQRTVGRPLIADLMMKYNYVSTMEEAFVRYLRTGASAFVSYKMADPQEVIELIANCGGISVLAHPSLEEFEAVVPSLSQAGLQGVEAFRPRISDSDSNSIAVRARNLGLTLTGGSDWHFDTRLLKLGDYSVDRDKIGAFLELVKQRQ